MLAYTSQTSLSPIPNAIIKIKLKEKKNTVSLSQTKIDREVS